MTTDIQIMFATPCSRCGQDIVRGEYARSVGWREWAHVECATRQEKRRFENGDPEA